MVSGRGYGSFGATFTGYRVEQPSHRGEPGGTMAWGGRRYPRCGGRPVTEVLDADRATTVHRHVPVPGPIPALFLPPVIPSRVEESLSGSYHTRSPPRGGASGDGRDVSDDGRRAIDRERMGRKSEKDSSTRLGMTGAGMMLPGGRRREGLRQHTVDQGILLLAVASNLPRRLGDDWRGIR